MIMKHFKWPRFGLNPAFYVDDRYIELLSKWRNTRQTSDTPSFFTKAYEHNKTSGETLSSTSILDSNNTTVTY